MRIGVWLSVGIIIAGVIVGGTMWWRGRIPALERQREALRAAHDATEHELAQLIKQTQGSDRVAPARQAVAAARSAYEQKVASSPTVAAAKRAADDAAAEHKATIDEELVTAPEVVAASKAADDADDAAFDVESELRIARFVLGEMERGVARVPEFQALHAEKVRADAAIYEVRRPKGSPAGAAAQAAYDAATKALDDAVMARLSTTAAGQAQLKVIADLQARATTLRAAHAKAELAVSAARARVLASNPRITRAADAAEQAATSYRAIVEAETDAERAALEDAQGALADAVRVAVQTDPKAVELNQQLDATLVKIAQIDARIEGEK